MSNTVVLKNRRSWKTYVISNIGGSAVDIYLTSDQKATYRKSIEKLMAISPTFKNIDKSIVENNLRLGNIPMRKFLAGSTIIEDGQKDCDHFFVLIHGNLIVKKDNQEIARIRTIGSFGVMWYINGEKREGTVIAESDCVVLIMHRAFIESLPDKIQNTLLRNLTAEMSKIIADINAERIHAQKSCSRQLGAIRQEVSRQIQELEITNP